MEELQCYVALDCTVVPNKEASECKVTLIKDVSHCEHCHVFVRHLLDA